MHNREKKLKGEDNERKNIETAKGKKNTSIQTSKRGEGDEKINIIGRI